MSLSWLPLDWVLLVIAVLSLGYVYLTWTYDYWKKLGIPYEEPTLFFGSMKDVILAKKTVGVAIEEIYWKLDGHKYGGIYRFREPALLIRDPDLIKSVLMKDFPNFQINGIHVNEELDPLLARNPFFLSGERWKHVRSQLSPAFTSGKLKLMIPLMEEVCCDLGQYLENTAHTSLPGGLEAKELAAKYTTDVVASCAFGIQGNSFKDPNAELRRMGRQFFIPTTWRNIQMLIAFLIPKLGSLLRIRLMTLELANFFRRTISEVVSYREKNNVQRNDLIQQLMQLKNKNAAEVKIENGKGSKPKFEYTNEDMTAHALTFFTDGFETSSTALSFVLYELAKNPEVQKKLRTEVEDVLNKNGGTITYEVVQQMTYLEKVICETLRHHPPLMTLEKECTSPFNMPTPSGGTYTIETGTKILIPVNALHSDPKYFPEPNKFDPERFSEENKQSMKQLVYLPFGEGPRMCLGMRFAQAQIKIGVLYLVRNFEIKKTPKTPDPLIQDPVSFLKGAKGGLWLDFIKIKK